MSSGSWSKFFWADWRSDAKLRMCGLAARGLWMEMLALMREASPSGHLIVNGKSPTNTQLAVLAGAPPELVPSLVAELESAGVFSRTRSGVIFSRRMIRDEKRAISSRINGRLGGNPSLSNGKDNSHPVNLQDNASLKAPHKPTLKPRARAAPT